MNINNIFWILQHFLLYFLHKNAFFIKIALKACPQIGKIDLKKHDFP